MDIESEVKLLLSFLFGFIIGGSIGGFMMGIIIGGSIYEKYQLKDEYYE